MKYAWAKGGYHFLQLGQPEFWLKVAIPLNCLHSKANFEQAIAVFF